jgi:inositol polyphosphate-4-phosphatase
MLISFEYLLTCDADELGMLEDSVEAIQALEHVQVRFVPETSKDSLLQPRFFGTRFYCKVVIPLPANMFDRLPQELKDGGSVRIVPVVFNIGIDHRASIARMLTLVIERKNNKNIIFKMLLFFF